MEIYFETKEGKLIASFTQLKECIDFKIGSKLILTVENECNKTWSVSEFCEEFKITDVYYDLKQKYPKSGHTTDIKESASMVVEVVKIDEA